MHPVTDEEDIVDEARTLAGPALAQALRDSRTRTLALVQDLSDAQWQVPCRPGLNPVAWELAHVAWFGEFWILRGPHRVDEHGLVHAAQPPRHAGPDGLLDSARLPHAERWRVDLPSRAQVLAMLQAQLEACVAALPQQADDEALYFHRLALFHEDMHGEAFAWLRATLGYPVPAGAADPPRVPAAAPARLAGGPVRVGWPAGRAGFAFDNERPGCTLLLDDFEIDGAPVSNQAFLRFVEDGGYRDPALWPGPAGEWRAASGLEHPRRWRRGADGWELRWFDAWRPLPPDGVAMHLSAWEAEAYCRWAGRRLPRAAEWEHAAAAGRIGWGGSVWEWTADAFQPYPGFRQGPYKDYSAPWFGDHRELRGGAFATHERLHHPRYRNFFRPERTDVFAGFRTVALTVAL
ncbi:MAG: selenoneine synthase SenA [Pseudomonadota bacterium]